VLWWVAMSLRARCFFFPTHFIKSIFAAATLLPNREFLVARSALSKADAFAHSTVSAMKRWFPLGSLRAMGLPWPRAAIQCGHSTREGPGRKQWGLSQDMWNYARLALQFGLAESFGVPTPGTHRGDGQVGECKAQGEAAWFICRRQSLVVHCSRLCAENPQA
jgi:hypothetical protein